MVLFNVYKSSFSDLIFQLEWALFQLFMNEIIHSSKVDQTHLSRFQIIFVSKSKLFRLRSKCRIKRSIIIIVSLNSMNSFFSDFSDFLNSMKVLFHLRKTNMPDFATMGSD